MEIKNFFLLESKILSSTFQVSPMGLRISNDKNSDDINLTKGNYNGINFPVVYMYESGKKFTDILDTGYVNLFLISDRMKFFLEENDLTGWKTYSIKIYDKEKNEIVGYHGFSIIGRCGVSSFKNSEIVERKFAPEGPICQYYKGLYIDINTWDGNDFFIPENSRMIITTKKASQVLKTQKLTNIYLENLCDYEMSVKAVAILEKRNETS